MTLIVAVLISCISPSYSNISERAILFVIERRFYLDSVDEILIRVRHTSLRGLVQFYFRARRRRNRNLFILRFLNCTPFNLQKDTLTTSTLYSAVFNCQLIRLSVSGRNAIAAIAAIASSRYLKPDPEAIRA